MRLNFLAKTAAVIGAGVPVAGWSAGALAIPPERAAEYVVAQQGGNDLAALLRAGRYAEAAKILQPLARSGNARAQFNLGVLYQKGDGVAKSDREAARWMKLAAEGGHVNAMRNIGGRYYFGQGIAQDRVRAHKWLSLAVQKGSRDSVAARDRAASSLSAAERRRSAQLVANWKPRPSR